MQSVERDPVEDPDVCAAGGCIPWQDDSEEIYKVC